MYRAKARTARRSFQVPGSSIVSVGLGEEKQQDLREAWAFARPSHQENVGVAVLSDEAGPAAVRGTFSVRRVGEQVGALYGEAVGAGL
ncbi:hypothetical protein [Salinibacter ruber]|uniref:hypothetical protein n=1 Tax=Salinibacter ruber TaxID=146919 RepID=UPI0021678EF3|nr:hypothetical protein [Salinibacter ruber]